LAEGRKPAILYAAKSTEDKRGSIPTQLEEGLALAERDGLEVVGEYADEAASAYTGNRGPELAKALVHAEILKASIIVQHSDRLARGDGKQARHLAELFFSGIRAGITFRSVQDDSTFDNPILVAVMGERNMEDSRRKSLAVKAGMERRRKRGLYSGGKAPYGYYYKRNRADEKRLVIHSARAKVVRRIFAEYLAGVSVYSIGRGLAATSEPTPGERPWSHYAVRFILMNPTYAGLLRGKGELMEAQHEAIVSLETWEKAEALREAKTRTHKRGRNPLGKHLFRKGFLRCGLCGSAMGPRSQREPGGNILEIYRCLGSAHEPTPCEVLSIPRAKVDNAVYDYCQGLDLDVEATRNQMTSAAERELAEARQEERESEARLKRVKRDYTHDKLTAEEWHELRDELEPELEAARAKTQNRKKALREAEEGLALAVAQAGILEALSEVREVLAKETRDAKGAAELAAVLTRLFEGFVLHLENRDQEHLALAGGGGWIEPLVIEYVTESYSGLKPVFSHSSSGT
jgi:DNA invertase Pin-like site-specific DNA recombinase